MKVKCIDKSLTHGVINGIEIDGIYDVEDQYNVTYDRKLNKTITIYVIKGKPFRSERFIPVF